MAQPNQKTNPITTPTHHHMASFITRVELHGADSADYQALNTAMEASGFSRAIPNNDGSAVFLPTGQYFGNGELEAKDVSAMAQGAALKTKKGFAIFVSDLTTAAWFGLDSVPDSNP